MEGVDCFGVAVAAGTGMADDASIIRPTFRSELLSCLPLLRCTLDFSRALPLFQV
jgi:hypothetical protein